MLTFGTNKVFPYIHTCHITCKSPSTAQSQLQIPLSCTCIALKSALRYPHILPQQSYLLDSLLYPLGFDILSSPLRYQHKVSYTSVHTNPCRACRSSKLSWRSDTLALNKFSSD